MYQFSEVVTAAGASIEARKAFLRRVYTDLVWSILVMIAGMYYVLSSPVRLAGVMRSSLLFIILYFGVFFWAQAVRFKKGVNFVALLIFAFISGVWLAPVIAFYLAGPGGVQVVMNAFFTTLLIFIGLTFYTMASKKDFSFMGSFLFSGLIALIGATFLAMIFGWSGAVYPMSIIGAILFSGLILYDTSRIMRYVPVTDHIGATLSLYLDFVNLFLFLLRIFGGRRD